MKKLIVTLMAVTVAGVASADMFAAMTVGYGIAGNGNGGGIVDAVDGTTIMLQVIAGGGDGLQSGADYDINTGEFVVGGNDALLGSWTTTVNTGGAYEDFAASLTGTLGGNGVAWVGDTYVRVSGIEQGNWVWQGAILFADADYSGVGAPPQGLFMDYDDGTLGGGYTGASADGSLSVNVVPEPATFGLMGLAGLGLFLARRKARR